MRKTVAAALPRLVAAVTLALGAALIAPAPAEAMIFNPDAELDTSHVEDLRYHRDAGSTLRFTDTPPELWDALLAAHPDWYVDNRLMPGQGAFVVPRKTLISAGGQLYVIDRGGWRRCSITAGDCH